MRILEVCRGLGLGGAERALVQRLAHAPKDVTTLILDLRPSISQLTPPESVEVCAVERPTPIGDLREILRVSREFEPDVIVTRTPRDRILVSLLRQRGMIPIHVSESHYERVAESKWSKSLAFALRWANAFVDLNIAVSIPAADGPQGQGSAALVVHHLGGSVNSEAEPSLPAIPGLSFLFLGRLIGRKRPDWLVDALAPYFVRFRKEGCRLAIVGDGPAAGKVASAIDRHHGRDVVEQVGSVCEPSGVLAASDVLLIPSLAEGLPLTVFESRLMGLLVISTPSGGTREVVSEADVVLDGFDADEMRAAVGACLDDMERIKATRSQRAAASLDLGTGPRAVIYYELLRSLVDPAGGG